MADEAFALSPISARAAQPSEEDYAAISEAFMETSRGRWFLGEYAKRNRNADTRLVLDAVARIEESLAAQKQTVADNTLTDALAAIRAVVIDAQASVTAALDGLALDQHVAPIRKGARVMREISWRLREIGADGRICDIIDAQAAVIEASSGQISASPARDAQDAAFAAIVAAIAESSRRDDAQASPRVDANVVPFPAPSEDASSESSETAVAAEAAADVVETATMLQTEPLPPVVEATAALVEPASALDEEAADAHDEAVLDLIAAEMAAPEPADDFSDLDDIEMTMPEAPAVESAPMAAATVAQEVAAEAIAAAGLAVQTVAPVAASAVAQTQFSMEAVAAAPVAEAEADVSLGSSILASGMLNKPARSASDPLAPIRRMSQAEKIAFFS